MLYCPNYTCQTPNPETHRFCQKCRTLLPRRYVWAVGKLAAEYGAGSLLADRYLCKGSRVFLDTKPGLPPTIAAELPAASLPYLHLTPFQLHIPQIYDWLQLDSSGPDGAVLLLEKAALQLPLGIASGQAASGQNEVVVEAVALLPALTDAWSQAAPLRQLSWLWQLAQLWQPLSSEQAALSLLQPQLLRVEGPLLRLVELWPNAEGTAPTLAQLGKLWLSWAQAAQPAIAPFLTTLAQGLIQGQIHSAEQLTQQLDWAIEQVGQGQSRRIHTATQTDAGPSRKRNEDACYPPSGSANTYEISPQGQPRPEDGGTSAAPALVIVCDGIGGHQGGDVASGLAIETVQQWVAAVNAEVADPAALTSELEQAACVANDRISQRNDSEQRRDRQRMGTTLVMALARQHELYITHVGDSRAYWITRWGCRQVTLDDDIASREVRLGYSPYREALMQPTSGSLVQALGMAASSMLYPTVQRFLLDEDGIFLLCSDGLSDNDRVEEVWDTVILPALLGQVDLATVAGQLVAIANTRNGHDNVTVGLVHCQVKSQRQIVLPAVSPTMSDMPAMPAAAPAPDESLPKTVLQPGAPPRQAAPAAAPAETVTTELVPVRSSPRLLPLLLSILVLLGVGGLLAYLLLPGVGDRLDRFIGLQPGDPSEPETLEPRPTAAPLTSLVVGSFVQISRSTAESSTNASSGNAGAVITLQPQPGGGPSPSPGAAAPAVNLQGIIPAGSIIQIVRKQELQGQERWVRLQICSVPGDAAAGLSSAPSPAAAVPSPAVPSPTASPALLQPGDSGWIEETRILPLVLASSAQTDAQMGACLTPSASPPAAVSPQFPDPPPNPVSP